MQYWLVKSDPEEYSFADLERENVTAWTGVRNYQARNYLRQMRTGDIVVVYHSGKERAVVGIARVSSAAYPDPTAVDDTQWECVDLQYERWLERPVTLDIIKQTPALKSMQLLKQARLSVMPLRAEEYYALLELARR